MHHSTDLKRMETHCDYAFVHPSINRDLFAAGTTAHAILERVAQLKPETDEEVTEIAEAVVEHLITEGRAFDGIPEPPLPVNAVMEGKAIALKYMMYNGLPSGEPEVGMAVDADLNPVEYLSPEALYGCIHDNIEFGVDDDGEMEYDVVVSTDYKSAWPTDAGELETMQRKGQALTLYARYKDKVQCLRMRVVNLRTGMSYEKDIFLDEMGVEMLEGWWRELKMVCRKADKLVADPGKAQPRPGIACVGCPLAAGECEEAWVVAMGGADQVDRYIAAQAVVDQSKPVIRTMMKNKTVTSGAGFKERARKVLKDDAIDLIVEQWCKGDLPWNPPTDQGELRALLLAANLGVTQVRNLAKVMFPGRELASDREAFIDSVTFGTTVAEFGVWK